MQSHWSVNHPVFDAIIPSRREIGERDPQGRERRASVPSDSITAGSSPRTTSCSPFIEFVVGDTSIKSAARVSATRQPARPTYFSGVTLAGPDKRRTPLANSAFK